MSLLGIIASQNYSRAPSSPVLTGLDQWYDASDSSTITSSGSPARASAMTNKATTSYTISQATGGQQPEVLTSSVNSKNTLKFTSARSDFLSNQTQFAPGNGATTMSFFLVVKMDNTTNGGLYMTGRDAGSGGYMPLSYFSSSKFTYQTGSGANALSATNTISSGTVALHYCNQVTSASIAQRVITNGATDTTSGTPSHTLDVGGGPGGYTPGVGLNTRGGFADFQFCEVLFYGTSLTTAQRDDNITYLKAKWGIT
jgi:hypothetical protein